MLLVFCFFKFHLSIIFHWDPGKVQFYCTCLGKWRTKHTCISVTCRIEAQLMFSSLAILNVDQKTLIKFARANVCGIFFLLLHIYVPVLHVNECMSAFCPTLTSPLLAAGSPLLLWCFLRDLLPPFAALLLSSDWVLFIAIICLPNDFISWKGSFQILLPFLLVFNWVLPEERRG